MTVVAEPIAEEKIDKAVLEVVSIPGRHQWTRAEFLRAHEVGFFTTNDKLELLKGEVFTQMTMLGPHAMALNLSMDVLRSIFRAGFVVRMQQPLALNEADLPEPDVAVVAGNARDYPDHPQTAVLVVEVSDTTLRRDRTLKAAIYAEAGIPEYWILNLNDRILEVHSSPSALASEPFGFGYRTSTRFSEGDSFSPLAEPEIVIAVADLLP